MAAAGGIGCFGVGGCGRCLVVVVVDVGCGWLTLASIGPSSVFGKVRPCGRVGSCPGIGLLAGVVFFGAEGLTTFYVVLQLEFKDLFLFSEIVFNPRECSF